MSSPEEPRQRLEALLATADIHHTSCGDGQLQWQHWSSASEAPLLLLLHGGFGSWNHWFANIDCLRARRDLWTVDLPGLGESANIHHAATPADFAARLHAGIQELWGDRQFELAGFSFGAMVGARLAQAAGEQCGRLVTIGAAGFGDLHVQVPLQPPPAPDTPWIESAPVHRANLRALMFSAGADIDDMAAYLHARNLARYRFNSRALSLTGDFLEALPAVAGRLCAVWGSEDATAGGVSALAERRQILDSAGADLRVLDGVGHWSMYEAPEAINRLLLEV